LVSDVKLRGFVTTPQPVASFLINWAVRSGHDVVFDIGVGEGVFLLEAYSRLLECGASLKTAPQQLLGVEVDGERYHATAQLLQEKIGIVPPLYLHSDFFALNDALPLVDAIVGNPPYVRRANLAEIEKIRERVLRSNLSYARLSSLSDLYIYFVLYALNHLKPGGRVALILPVSWLDVDYGIPLKQLLVSNFKIQGLVLLESPVFQSVLVRPLLLLAEKVESKKEHKVRFIRFHNEVTDAGSLMRALDGQNQVLCESMQFPQGSLDPQKPWGIFLKTPSVYQGIVAREGFVPLGKLAESRIGIQTLARRFYVLSREEITRRKIATTNVKPIILSPRDLKKTVIESPEEVSSYVLYVDQAKENLDDHATREYIEEGERIKVSIRGKDVTVTGYQNLPRIQQARRKPWYNLKKDIDRRGCYPILLPRRFYEKFVVGWNRACVVVNENFIEIKPLEDGDLLALLAVLNSSVFELIARSHAQLYGGGVYNLNPADVPCLPVLNVGVLPAEVRINLAEAGHRYLRSVDEEHRELLDSEVTERAMNLSSLDKVMIQEAVLELRKISLRAKVKV
jgi:hypothetical protein